MSHGRDSEGSMPADVFRQVEKVCQAFEAAWQSGERPRIGDYIAGSVEPVRSALLRELALLDSEYAAQLGESPPQTDSLGEQSSGMCLQLDVVVGPHSGQRFTCTGHSSFIVGRASCAHFRLPRADPYFSRVHLMIEVNPPCCRLFDMGSTNGTKLNGQRIESADLSDGDLIHGGDTVLRVSLLGNWGVDARQRRGDLAERPQSGEPGSPSTESMAPRRPRETAMPASPIRATTAVPEQDRSPRVPAIPGYRMERELGRGGMGVVYEASRIADAGRVAIKTIRPMVAPSPREMQRFLREAAILGGLRHPHIVPFLESGEAGQLLYFVMEYIAGTDAFRIVKDQGPMPPSRAVPLLCQTLDALQYAHQEGFVHRDVKPANLLVTGDRGAEVCKLADFGLARAYLASSMSGLTMMGDVGGTLPYMPPEQITNYREAKPPADQYAAAATLYYLLTRCHVFDFTDLPAQDRIAKVLCDEPVPIGSRGTDIPKGLARAIHRALDKNPARRFHDAAALRDALLSFAG